MEKEILMTIPQAGKMLQVTNQGVYLAIKTGRLKARKNMGAWRISEQACLDYIGNRYSRDTSLDKQGKLLFDHKLGNYSVKDISLLADVSTLKIYYLIYNGKIEAGVNGCSYVIHVDDMTAFLESVKCMTRKKLAHIPASV